MSVSKKLIRCVILDLDGTLLNTGLFPFVNPEYSSLLTVEAYNRVAAFFFPSKLGLYSITLAIVNVIDADGIVGNVLKVLLGKYGKEWDGREAHKIRGTTPFEAAAAVVQDYELSCSTTEFLSEISPLFSDQ